MALTKSGSNVVASSSVSAGAAVDSTISSDIDLTGAYEAVITGKVTNGGTGPTVGCTVNCYISRDTTNYILFQSLTAGNTASAAYPFTFILPDAAMHAKIGFGGNTAQAVTVVADLQQITAL